MYRIVYLYSMHQARYYKKIVGRRVQCTLCPHSCLLLPGQQGICGVRENRAGRLYTHVYGLLSALAADPIEKKPLYHFYPGRQVLSIGSLGCNLKCDFCQNHHISQPGELLKAHHPLRQAIEVVEKAALIRDNVGLAYTYNEPTTNLEFVCDCAALVHDRGMANVFVSNGYIQEGALETLLPLMDGFNIDLKAFSNDFYRTRAHASLDPVLRSIDRIAHSEAHLEITFLLIPGHNDDPDQWRQMIDWIADHCGEDTVLHLSRYSPRYRLQAPPTPTSVMEAFLQVARESLHFVYPGNHPHLDSDTHCPSCGALMISRKGYQTLVPGMDKEGHCIQCGTSIPGVFNMVS